MRTFAVLLLGIVVGTSLSTDHNFVCCRWWIPQAESIPQFWSMVMTSFSPLPVVDWFDWLSSGAQRSGAPYALVTVVCNGTRYSSNTAEGRSTGFKVVNRAAFLRWSIRKRESSKGGRMLDKIALAHSLEQSAMAHLARMGWRVLDISRVAPMLHPMFTQQHGHHWPRANNGSNVLRRKDGNWCATRLTDCALRSLRSRERKSALVSCSTYHVALDWGPCASFHAHHAVCGPCDAVPR